MDAFLPILLVAGAVGLVLAIVAPLTLMIQRHLGDRRDERAATASPVEVVALTDPWTEFDRELQRTRRTERPCALLWTRPTAASAGVLDIAASIAGRIRAVDRVWVEDDEIFILLPETTADGAQAALVRMTRSTDVLDAMSIRQAVFPEDGLTRDALLRSLRDSGREVTPLRETA